MNQAIDRRELWFKAMAGLAGGAIGWIPVEIVSHGQSLTEAQSTGRLVAGMLSMAILAGAIGGLILAAEGKTIELTAQAKRRFWRGFVICFVLSIPASILSDLAFSAILAAGGWGVDRAGSLAYMILARVTGWTLMGLMLGVGVGLAAFSLKNIANGAIGGFIGGFAGGILFDAVGAVSQTGLASRLIGLAAIGLAIGLFIGLVQELTKTAWVAVEAGRLRGRQFRLEGAAAMVGRAEENAVGLFGDPGVQPRHAVIERTGAAYSIRNLAVQQGTLVNGNRVETAPLHDGDRIKISNYEIVFHERRGGSAAQVERTSISIAPAPSVRPPEPLAARAPDAPAPPAVAGNAYLLASDGQRYPLRSGTATRLGRALDNDVVINHASVSRHHASIEGNGSGYRVRDLGSQNGTFVDGQKVSEASVGNGATVKLGDAILTFHQ